MPALSAFSARNQPCCSEIEAQTSSARERQDNVALTVEDVGCRRREERSRSPGNCDRHRTVLCPAPQLDGRTYLAQAEGPWPSDGEQVREDRKRCAGSLYVVLNEGPQLCGRRRSDVCVGGLQLDAFEDGVRLIAPDRPGYLGSPGSSGQEVDRGAIAENVDMMSSLASLSTSEAGSRSPEISAMVCQVECRPHVASMGGPSGG
jgi:hypothetical protein